MHRTLTCLALAVSLAVSLPLNAAERADEKATQILKASREALGGEARLAGVQSIVAKGRHRRTMGEMQIDGDTEITISLPDKYLRGQSDTIMGNIVNREVGFAGDELVDRTQSLGGRGGTMVFRPMGPGGQQLDPEARKAMMLRAQRAELSRLLLGWLVATPEFMEATFTYAGEAESPDGRAHVLEVVGRDNFAAKLFIDQMTNRPVMLTYMAPQPVMRIMRGGPGGPGRSGVTPDDVERQAREQGPPPTVEMQWFFEDYQEVGGVWLPHRLSRAADGEPIEELEIERFRVNDAIKASTFQTK
jgi:hypothetical protein